MSMFVQTLGTHRVTFQARLESSRQNGFVTPKKRSWTRNVALLRPTASQPPQASVAGTTSTSSSPSTSTSTSSTSPQTNEAKTFEWTQSWYPVTALDMLDPSKPQAITILGFDVVVWADADGDWRCFRDACPHRQAPLSEGIINPKSGNLQCAYHGWSFKGSGSCAYIPQSDDVAAMATATASKRSCCIAYPTASAHGLLWVWLESGEAGQEASAASPLPKVPACDGQGREWFQVAPWYIRDLEVDWQALMENSADPSHVHWTHAGFIGAPDRAGPVNVHEIKQGSYEEEKVYHLECDDPKKSTFKTLDVRPPCMLWAASEGMKGGELALLYFVVPISPGRSRLMSLAKSTNTTFRLPARIFHVLPFLRHLFSHQVAAQDAAILHRQGTNMSASDFKGWKRGFYLPTKSDGGVAVLRRWLENSAGGDVAWGPNVDPSPRRQALINRDLLFDNWNQHTKHCPHCLKALKWVKFFSMATAIGAAGCAAKAFWLMMSTKCAAKVTPPGVFGCVLWALVFLLIRFNLEKMRANFYFTDWQHSNNKKLLQI